MDVCVPCVCSDQRGLKTVSDPLELEVQVVVVPTVWVLEIKPQVLWESILCS